MVTSVSNMSWLPIKSEAKSVVTDKEAIGGKVRGPGVQVNLCVPITKVSSKGNL